MGSEKDLPPGEALVARLRPFLEHLALPICPPKPFSGTWTTYGPSKKEPMEKILRDRIDEEGGPFNIRPGIGGAMAALL